MRREADRTKKKGTIEHWTYWHDFAEKNLFGIEINEELARVAKMNMIIHDDGHTNIVGHDALDFLSKLTAVNDGLKPARFDLVLQSAFRLCGKTHRER